MAEAPKRRKLERVEEPMPISSQKFYCARCPSSFSRQKGYFPVSHSPMYRSSGYLPWCNDCVDAMYEKYRNEYRRLLGDERADRAAMRRMCMKLDLYWDNSIYDMVEKTAGVQSRVRSYIGKTNIVRYIDKTFDDTIAKEELDGSKQFRFVSKEGLADDELSFGEEYEVSDEVRKFWGPDYTPEVYAKLEERLSDWKSKYPPGYKFDIGEEAIIKQICGLEVDIARDRAAERPVKDSVSTLNTLIGSANLKPSQKKDGADAELENMPLGVGIQKWENFRPLPATAKDKRDVNGIVKNVTTWMLGHLCKMVGLRNSYCKMYEDEMNRLRVSKPEYDDEDDDSFLSDLFGSSGGDDE